MFVHMCTSSYVRTCIHTRVYIFICISAVTKGHKIASGPNTHTKHTHTHTQTHAHLHKHTHRQPRRHKDTHHSHVIKSNPGIASALFPCKQTPERATCWPNHALIAPTVRPNCWFAFVVFEHVAWSTKPFPNIFSLTERDSRRKKDGNGNFHVSVPQYATRPQTQRQTQRQPQRHIYTYSHTRAYARDTCVYIFIYIYVYIEIYRDFTHMATYVFLSIYT